MLRYSRTGRVSGGRSGTTAWRSRGAFAAESASERVIEAHIEPATRTELRRADADAGSVAQEVHAIGDVDRRERDIEIVGVRQRKPVIGRRIDLPVRRQMGRVGEVGAQTRAVDVIGAETRAVPEIAQAAR